MSLNAQQEGVYGAIAYGGSLLVPILTPLVILFLAQDSRLVKRYAIEAMVLSLVSMAGSFLAYGFTILTFGMSMILLPIVWLATMGYFIYAVVLILQQQPFRTPWLSDWVEARLLF